MIFATSARLGRFFVAGLGILAAMSAVATEGMVQLEFSTVSDHGKFSPRHVLAVWVTDANTNFIKTVCRYGGKRQKYLSTWLEERGENLSVDGITGATAKAHETRTVTWNGRDASNKPLPDGAYLLFIEFTGAHAQGPKAAFPVTKGAKAQVKTFPDQEHFKNVKLTFTPAGR